MPHEMMVLIPMVLLWLLGFLAFYRRFLRNWRAPVKTVKAKVIDKHTLENFSRYSGNGKSVKYVVVFSAEGRKLSFYVSGFSYNGFRLNESGTLKYQGDRLIEFN